MDQKSSITTDQSSAEEENDQKPVDDQPSVACPRCHSFNTKFCYFNNYNVKQPRHFCRECQRYWTAGGSLRNVPVGAGRRRNKGSSPTISSNGAIVTPYHNDHMSRSLFTNHHGSDGHEGMCVSSSSSPPVDSTVSSILSFKQPAMATNLSESAQRSFALLHNLSETQKNFAVLAQKHPSELTQQNIAVLQKIHSELTQHNLAALQKNIHSEARQNYEAMQRNGFETHKSFSAVQKNHTEAQHSFGVLQSNQPGLHQNFTVHQKNPSEFHEGFTVIQKNASETHQSFLVPQNNPSQTSDSFNAAAETMEKKPDRNVSLELKLSKANGEEKVEEGLQSAKISAENKMVVLAPSSSTAHHPLPAPPPPPPQDLPSSLHNTEHDESTCCSSVTAALACSSSEAVSHPATATTIAMAPSNIVPPVSNLHAGYVNPSPLMFHPWLWPFILNSTGALLGAGIPRFDPSFAAAFSAMALAQTDPTLAAKIAAMASLNGVMASNGAMASLNGAMAINGAMTSNGAMASLNGSTPSNGAVAINGAMSALNGAMPTNGALPSLNGAVAFLNGSIPSNGAAPLNGVMPQSINPQVYQSSTASSNTPQPYNPASISSSSIAQAYNQASMASSSIPHGCNPPSMPSSCVPQTYNQASMTSNIVPRPYINQASIAQTSIPPSSLSTPHVDPALMAHVAALASGSMAHIDPSLTAALAASYLQWQQQAWNPYTWGFPWNLQWNTSNTIINTNTNMNTANNSINISTANAPNMVNKRPRSPPTNEEQLSALEIRKTSKKEADTEDGTRNHSNGPPSDFPHPLGSLGAFGSFNPQLNGSFLTQKAMAQQGGVEQSDQQSKPSSQAQSVVSQEGT